MNLSGILIIVNVYILSHSVPRKDITWHTSLIFFALNS